MPRFDEASLRDFAQPTASRRGGRRLRDVLAPLWQVASLSPSAAFGRAIATERAESLVDQLSEHPDRRFARVRSSSSDLRRVFANYDKRLARTWVRWMSWAHWVYESALPPDLPGLLAAVESLIAVESQLHVAAAHPNRDHVVHPLADAQLAVALYRHARERDASFDSSDWSTLVGVVSNVPRDQRTAITECGLALAGMFHDVGYLRYVGEGDRRNLAGLGIVAPPTSVDLWAVAEVFTDSYLDRILGEPGLFGDVYVHAWERDWHGPLGGFVLASAAQALRADGRLSPTLDAVFQIAAAAAALHELHDSDAPPARVPRAIEDARKLLRNGAYSWPGLFRIVDDLHCWARPSMAPDGQRRMYMRVDLGAKGCAWDAAGDVIIVGRRGSRSGVKEASALTRLASREPALMARLGLSSFAFRSGI